MYYTEKYVSPMGDLLLESDGENLTGLWFSTQKDFEMRADDVQCTSRLSAFEDTRAWLDRYFTGVDPGPIPLVRLKGTEFQQRVWELLAEISYGQLTTYGELACRIATERGIKKMSSRAVGQAVGHNPISIIIPCHRVIGSSGSLTGYGGGIVRKIQLLKLEGVDTSKLKVPAAQA